VKTAIVTGGAGFIGSYMVDKLLKENYFVKVLDNFSGGHKKNLKHINSKNLEVINKDITQVNSNNNIFKNIDVIFHFAGLGDVVPSIEKPLDYFNVNVQGTINILNAAKLNNIENFIYAASSSCYGIADVPTTEEHPINPQYPYALSKYMGELSVMHWRKVYKLNCKSIRIFNAYGRRVRTTGAYGAVFGVFFKQKLEKKPLTIVGNGKQKRDFLHVKDVVDAFYEVYVTDTKDCIFNVGAGNPQSVLALVKLIDGNFKFIPKRPGEPDATWADISKITSQTKWSPKINFKKGVEDMMNNIEDWKDAPLWNEENISKATETWFKYLGK
jgi:UDP-glucose 4-epimerase